MMDFDEEKWIVFLKRSADMAVINLKMMGLSLQRESWGEINLGQSDLDKCGVYRAMYSEQVCDMLIFAQKCGLLLKENVESLLRYFRAHDLLRDFSVSRVMIEIA